jgi:twitching motility protein PilT
VNKSPVGVLGGKVEDEGKQNNEMMKYLDFAIEKEASDIHLSAGISPTVRIDGKLVAIPETQALSQNKIRELIDSFTPKEMVESFKQRKELDFSFGFKDVRFRVNLYFQKGFEAASLRIGS